MTIPADPEASIRPATSPTEAMSAAEAISGTAATSASEAPSTGDESLSLTALFDRWIVSIRWIAKRWLTVAALEARLAALNFTLMLMVAVASGLLLASAWIALFAAIVAGLHALGLGWHLALLLVALVNFLLAVLGFYYINRMSKNLIFNTLRALVAEPEQPDANNIPGPAARNGTHTTPS
jgi:hypothetical protein